METLNDLITEMFMFYVRSEEYASLNASDRNKFVDQIEMLKELATPEA